MMMRFKNFMRKNRQHTDRQFYKQKLCQYADSFFSFADKAFISRFNAHLNRIELTEFYFIDTVFPNT